MALSSMTGFARAEGEKDICAWVWEIKSVNAKGLDVRCRLANGFERLEQAVRKQVQKRFKRGNVSLSLSVSRPKGDAGFRVNHAVLEELLAILPEIEKQLPNAGKPSIDGLLGLRGVIEPVEDDLKDADRQAFDETILADLDAALGALSAMRDEEGGRLAPGLNQRLDDIGRLCEEAEKLAAAHHGSRVNDWAYSVTDKWLGKKPLYVRNGGQTGQKLDKYIEQDDRRSSA